MRAVGRDPYLLLWLLQAASEPRVTHGLTNAPEHWPFVQPRRLVGRPFWDQPRVCVCMCTRVHNTAHGLQPLDCEILKATCTYYAGFAEMMQESEIFPLSHSAPCHYVQLAPQQIDTKLTNAGLVSEIPSLQSCSFFEAAAEPSA